MTQAAETLISELKDYIEQAQTACTDGSFTDMADMQPKVEEMCAAIAQLPVTQARQHSDTLEEIAKSLDALKGVMEEKREALRGELNSTTQHHQAAKAYKTAEAGMPPLPPSEKTDQADQEG
jgi:hypothetical protein